MSSRTAAAEATDNTPSILPGKLLVIEGIDRSGRSTQVQLLVEWLRHNGIEPVRTDWSTSPHISKAIHKAKAAGELRPITFSLFYAADFTDRIANVVVPALERGQIVVADRYVYTAFARDIARGAAPGLFRTTLGLFSHALDLVVICHAVRPFIGSSRRADLTAARAGVTSEARSPGASQETHGSCQGTGTPVTARRT